MAKLLLLLGTATGLGLIVVIMTRDPESIESRLLFFGLLGISLFAFFSLATVVADVNLASSGRTIHPYVQGVVGAVVVVAVAFLKSIEALNAVNVVLLAGIVLVTELTLLSRH